MKLNFLKVLIIALVGAFITVESTTAAEIDSSQKRNDQKRYESIRSNNNRYESSRYNTNRYESSRYDQKRPTNSIRDRHTYSSPAKKIVVPSSKISYRKPKTAIKVMRTLPHGAVMVKSYGSNIYHSNGRYYRRDVDRYVAVHPPVGLRINVLPIGYKVLRFMGRLFYYAQGTYYSNIGNQYQVVMPPDDIIVDSLPMETEIITINGREYYIYNGLVYSEVVTPRGRAFKLNGELEIR